MATDEASRSSPHPKKPALRVYIVHRKAIREVRVRPWLAATAIVLGGIFFMFYFAAAGYLVFRDDLLAASFARQARQKQAYEDRIASLRADIDNLASRQLLNQEEFEARTRDGCGSPGGSRRTTGHPRRTRRSRTERRPRRRG